MYYLELLVQTVLCMMCMIRSHPFPKTYLYVCVCSWCVFIGFNLVLCKTRLLWCRNLHLQCHCGCYKKSINYSVIITHSSCLFMLFVNIHIFYHNVKILNLCLYFLYMRLLLWDGTFNWLQFRDMLPCYLLSKMSSNIIWLFFYCISIHLPCIM